MKGYQTTAAQAEAEWLIEYYSGAIGLTINSVSVSEDGFPQLICTDKNKNKFTLEVSCDEEGNRRGFLFGLPNPE